MLLYIGTRNNEYNVFGRRNLKPAFIFTVLCLWPTSPFKRVHMTLSHIIASNELFSSPFGSKVLWGIMTKPIYIIMRSFATHIQLSHQLFSLYFVWLVINMNQHFQDEKMNGVFGWGMCSSCNTKKNNIRER